MATAVTATTFKTRFTTFSAVADAVVTTAINEAVRWVGASAFGSQARADDGINYLTAHILALDAQLNALTAAGGASGPGGPVSSMATLGASVSYAVPTGAGGDYFSTTPWGLRFLSIQKRVFASRIL